MNTIYAEETGGEDPSSSSLFSKTCVKSALVYMDKMENGVTKPSPIQSREERISNVGALYLMLKVNVSDADAKYYKDNVIYIFKLNSYQNSSDISTMEPVTNFSVKQDTGFEFQVKVNGNFSDLNSGDIFCKYVMAVSNPSASVRYTPISDARYIDDVNNLANANDVPREAKTKKGLQLQMLGEAKLLGVEHTVINIFLNDIISPRKSDNTETFTYKGESFYFNAAVLAEYDRKVKFLNDQNVLVTAVLLLRPSSAPSDETSIENILIHKNNSADSSTFFCGINTADSDGAKYFEAIMSFLADRYFIEGSKSGRISNVILGDEIGRSSEFNNCGIMTADEYIADYMRALRIADTAVRSRFGGARVYVPIDKYFASKPEPDYNYINKELIDLICEYSVKEGNFPWNIAFHAYNEDIKKAAFWRETSPTNDFDTPVITMKNIEVLINYINTEKGAYLKDSKKRKILLSDQGFSSGDNSTEDQKLQAAAFCYAYNKIRFIPEIEAFIYHRQVDSTAEPANFGLWQENENSPGNPGTQKPLYDVFKFMETDKEEEFTEFAKAVLNISDWSEKIPGYTTSQPKTIITEAVNEKAPSNLSREIKTKFNNADLAGFLGTLNAKTPGVKTYDKKYALSIGVQNSTAGDWFGVFKNYDASAPLDLKSNKYMQINFRIDTELTGVTKIPFCIILEGYETSPQPSDASATPPAQNTGVIKDGGGTAADITVKQKHIYEGAADVDPNKDVELYFQIDKWAENKTITGIRLLINPTSSATPDSEPGEDEDYYSETAAKDDFTLIISSIMIAKNAKLSLVRLLLNIILIIIGVVVALYLILFIRAQMINYKRRKRRELKRQRELERRRNEQNRLLRLPPGANPGNRPKSPPQNRNRPKQ